MGSGSCLAMSHGDGKETSWCPSCFWPEAAELEQAVCTPGTNSGGLPVLSDIRQSNVCVC